jgi:PHP domain
VLKATAALAVLVVLGAAVFLIQRRAAPRFEREIPWAGKGVWLTAETHVHSSFSDGSHTVDELVDRAVANGCDVLAITDHLDAGLKAATLEYHAALAAGRKRQPSLVLITGFEWNVPPGKGQDHAVLLVPPGLDAPEVWAEFKRRFDDLDKEGENAELAVEAFQWMRALSAEEAAGPPVMFLNHPSRRAANVDVVASQLEFLAGAGDGVFVGVEGAPGHQKANPLGAYGGRLTPEDRWDPSIVTPGAAWDRQLAGGRPLAGALATSDFHSEANGDYWPCEFSATRVYARDRSTVGVIQALRAGSFVGVHGGLARDVQLTLSADGLPRAAIAGESVRLRAGTPATIEVRAAVPDTDWEGMSNRLDLVELIGAGTGGTTVLNSGPLVDGVLRHQLTVPTGGLAVRARGRKFVENSPDLLFYTNAILVR